MNSTELINHLIHLCEIRRKEDREFINKLYDLTADNRYKNPKYGWRANKPD